MFCNIELTSKFGSVDSANGFGKPLSTEGNCSSCDGRANDDEDCGIGDEAVIASDVVTFDIRFDQSDANEFTSEVVSSKDSKSIRSDGQRVARKR